MFYLHYQRKLNINMMNIIKYVYLILIIETTFKQKKMHILTTTFIMDSNFLKFHHN